MITYVKPHWFETNCRTIIIHVKPIVDIVISIPKYKDSHIINTEFSIVWYNRYSRTMPPLQGIMLIYTSNIVTDEIGK